MYREKKTCGIYRIEHKDTGKSYVGLSVDIFKRWKEHSNFWQAKAKWSVIKQALHKHGLENFNFTILEECFKDELAAREIHWIKELNTQAPNGYNMTSGGEGCTDPSEEVRTKMKKAATGVKRSDEVKEKMAKKKNKACVINGVEYESVNHAKDALGFKQQTLSTYLRKNKWPEGYTGYFK